MKAPHVWVIEMMVFIGEEKWYPCAESALNKGDAREKMSEWRVGNPGNKFRIAKYQRVEK